LATYPLNMERHLVAPRAEATANAASIERVPPAVLPRGLARTTVLDLARACRECSCYASVGEQSGTWCVWLGDLANVRSDRNGRVPLTDEWVPRWRELLAEMGLPATEEASR
jgi:hypothetical protein